RCRDPGHASSRSLRSPSTRLSRTGGGHLRHPQRLHRDGLSRLSRCEALGRSGWHRLRHRPRREPAHPRLHLVLPEVLRKSARWVLAGPLLSRGRGGRGASPPERRRAGANRALGVGAARGAARCSPVFGRVPLGKSQPDPGGRPRGATSPNREDTRGVATTLCHWSRVSRDRDPRLCAGREKRRRPGGRSPLNPRRWGLLGPPSRLCIPHTFTLTSSGADSMQRRCPRWKRTPHLQKPSRGRIFNSVKILPNAAAFLTLVSLLGIGEVAPLCASCGPAG